MHALAALLERALGRLEHPNHRESCPSAGRRGLAARLRGRGTDRAGEVARRLRIAENEFRAARHFDAVVINRAVEDTVTTVMEIVAAVREGAAAQVAVERSLEQLRAQLPPPLDEWVQP